MQQTIDSREELIQALCEPFGFDESVKDLFREGSDYTLLRCAADVILKVPGGRERLLDLLT
jgi:hypothetical protein